jgi:hypothetical protein
MGLKTITWTAIVSFGLFSCLGISTPAVASGFDNTDLSLILSTNTLQLGSIASDTLTATLTDATLPLNPPPCERDDQLLCG